MGNGSGVSRGDLSRNARLERLRALVPVTSAIVGIDLAGSKQMVVLTGHTIRRSSRGGCSGAAHGILAQRWTGPQAAPRRRAGRG
jgi:transposase